MDHTLILQDGGRLNYLLYSEKQSENGTIIFIHGLTGNKYQLTNYMDELKKQYQVIAVNLRGRGDSSAQVEDSSIETHTGDIKELIDSLQLKNIVLFGYSMGAFISQRVAGEHPSVERVILLDGGGAVDEEGKQMVYPSIGRMEKVYPDCRQYTEETAAVYEKLKVDVGPHVMQAIEYECREKDGGYGNPSDPKLIKQDFDSFYSYDVQQTLEHNKLPTLLITGEGNLSDRPLFTRANYEPLRKAANIQVTETSENHYELAFNRQSELLQQINDFLKGELSNEK